MCYICTNMNDDIHSAVYTSELDRELSAIVEKIKSSAKSVPEDKREAYLNSVSELFQNLVLELEGVEDSALQLKSRIDVLPQFVHDIDAEFERATGLTRTDYAFLVFAAVLQIIRQVFINQYKQRLDDQEAAKRIRWHTDEHSNRNEAVKYYASIEEIKSNPVPFDAIMKESSLKQSGDSPRISGFNHRYKALGHDPVLGLVFGTANILTKTLTMTDGKCMLKSYHVHTGIGYNGVSEYDIDKISERASTALVFSNIYRRIEMEGKKGWRAVRVALAKEIVHLLTDVRTQKSLPLPFVSMLSPKLSQLLNYAEIDTLTLKIIGKEAGLAALINYVVASLHSWCYDPEKDGDRDLYSVRTKKIIQYSGEIALTSTVLQTAVKVYLGDMSNIKYFDYGGSLVSLSRTWNSPLEIARIKGEFLLKNCKQYIEQQ